MASLHVGAQVCTPWGIGVPRGEHGTGGSADLGRRTTRELDDGALVDRVVRGDKEAFAELSSRHRPRVRRMVRAKVRDREDARDIEQDVFIKAYTSLRELKTPSRFGAWVNMIVRHACTDYMRRRARERAVSLDEPLDVDGDEVQREFPDVRTEPSTVLAFESMRRDYESAVSTLTDASRAAFLLREEDDLSMEEIADRTDVSVGGVKSLIYRARRKLEAALEPHLAA